MNFNEEEDEENKFDVDNNENNNDNDNDKENLLVNNVQIIPYLMSEYSFIIIIFLLVAFSFCVPQYHTPKIFHSKKVNTPFNPSYIPKIFFHLTDIHVSHVSPAKTQKSFEFLKTFINYNPDLILVTGDIVDNYASKKFQLYGEQSKEDWELFNNTIYKLISKYPIVDVEGNHDIWALDSATSKKNFYLDYFPQFNRTNVQKEDDYIIKKIKLMNFTFILFNDYRFPVSRPPYGLEPHTTKYQLDLLENMIDNL